MNYSNWCLFNGELVQYGKFKMHVSDLLLQRSYGVFDFFRCRNGRFPWLDDYLDRLINSVEISGLDVSMDRTDFTSAIYQLQEKNFIPNGAFKFIVSGGYSDNLESVSGPPNIMILNRPWNPPLPETCEKGIGLISERFVRPNPEVKTLYYFNTLRLQKRMKEFNAADVLYYTDNITEASRVNLFFVKRGRISTPLTGILHGITRKQVLSLVPEIVVEEIPSGSLYDFDEIFLTSTTREVTPVISLDDKKIGRGERGPVTREIQALFQKSLLHLMRGEL